MMSDWMQSEVRNGEWITYEARPGSTLTAGPRDERSPEQMRRDTLIERVARAIARAEHARDEATVADPLSYETLRSQQIAAEAEIAALIATVRTLRGDEEADQIEAAARRIWRPEEV